MGRPGVLAVEVYATVRQFVLVEGRSRWEAARVFDLNRETVAKICRFSVPPWYRREQPPVKPKLGPFILVIDAILEADRDAPVKQRHTAQRIFERLRDEHGYTGGYTVVKDYVRPTRLRLREAFVPLSHPPGHAQVDFWPVHWLHRRCADGDARLLHGLPHSDAPFVKAYPAETTQAFLDGHVLAFAFFGCRCQ